MPNINTKGNWSGTVVETYLSDKFIFKCKVETEDGQHAYPSMFLLNQAGGVNDEACKDLNELFGWDGEDPNHLKNLAKGKKVKFYTKIKGEYCNAFFAVPSKQKQGGGGAPQIEAKTALEVWRNAKAGIAVSVSSGEVTDLKIDEAGIPF